MKIKFVGDRDEWKSVRMRPDWRLDFIKVPPSCLMFSSVLSDLGMSVQWLAVSVLLLYKLLLTKTRTICLQ